MASADIHYLRNHLDGETSRRLAQTLAASFQNGEDLGPRDHQVNAIMSSLDSTLKELRIAAELLPNGPGNITLLMHDLQIDLLRFCNEFESIAVTLSARMSGLE